MKRYNWFIEHVWTKTSTEYRVCRTPIGESPQHHMPLYYIGRMYNSWWRNGFTTSPGAAKHYKAKDAARRVMMRLARRAAT